MTTATLNDPVLATYIRKLEDINHQARLLLDGLNERQLQWVPPEGGWSVGLIFEHLIKGGQLYNDLLANVIADARQRGLTNGGKPWKPTMMGRFLRRAMRSPRKFPTFSVFDPSQQVGEWLLERFLEVQQRLIALVNQSDGLDLTRVRMRSPVSTFIRFNLGDCFGILVDHTIRHLRQAQRLKDHGKFPRAETE